MDRLPYPDYFYLEAAKGWIDLGNMSEARQELGKVSANLLIHPAVLSVRARLFAKENQWDVVLELSSVLCELAPDVLTGWLFRARALQELGRAQKAYEMLCKMKDKFPGVAVLFYELARSAMRIEKVPEARCWLQMALLYGDADSMQTKAIRDPELKKLWQAEGSRFQG